MRQAPARSVLFAAGRGERVRPLSDSVPKPCLPILGVPLGAWMLGALRAAAPGVTVNASHLADSIVTCLGLEGAPEVEVFVERPVALGTAGTLRALIDRLDDRVLVCNSDLLCDLDPSVLLEAHSALGGPVTLAVADVTSGADFVVSDGCVDRFVDRRREDVGGSIFLGMGVYERSALAALPDSVPLGLAEALLAPLADRGDLGAHVHDGYARDVGTIESYLRASFDVLANTAPVSPRPLPGEVVDVDGGRAFVGHGADVAQASLGPDAIVLPGAAVGQGAELRRAIVWAGQPVPAGTRVEDAVWFEGDIVKPQPHV